MAKIDLTQLEQATTVPGSSLHIIEMGDGSGTKAVTQETLTTEVGKGLKVGDLAGLQTNAKGSLVAAINEAAQSGGSGEQVDILDSKETIEANTTPGKAAGALAVKQMVSELNDKLTSGLGGCTFGLTVDGKPGWKDGADTVHPFKNVEILHIENHKGTYKNVTINFENKAQKEILLCYGIVPTNSGQYFFCDFVHDIKYGIQSISKTDESIIIVRPNSSTSSILYDVFIALA